MAGGRWSKKRKEHYTRRKGFFLGRKKTRVVLTRQYKVTITYGNQFKFEKRDPPVLQDGIEYKIINLEQMAQYVGEITIHVATCEYARDLAIDGKQPMTLLGEISRFGLASVLSAECNGCHKQFKFNSSPILEIDGVKRFEINVRAVWGQCASGGGCRPLNEVMSTLGVSGLSGGTFTKIEEEIGTYWKKVLDKEMMEAAEEEKQLAIKEGRVLNGVPWTKVIHDTGWGKRTHKHTYNASGGVSVVYGYYTKRLLDILVRQKTCSVCTFYENRGEEPPPHNCSKNWDKSSQQMESDMLLEAFLTCEEKYGLIYLKYIADGDSSGHAILIEQGPLWCRHPMFEKLECANHAVKCLRGHLETTVNDKKEFKHRLTRFVRIKMCSAMRCAIKRRSQEKERRLAIVTLENDIKNIPRHCLGYHSACSADFCKNKQGGAGSCQSTTDSNLNEDEGEDIEDSQDLGDVMEQQARYWSEGSSENDMEDSRSSPAMESEPEGIDKDIIYYLQPYMNYVANKAQKLIGNETTNLAESWMAIRTKFDGGKRVDRCKKYAWRTRCWGAGLRSILGHTWSPRAWEVITRKPATKPMWRHYERCDQRQKATRKSQANPVVKANAFKAKKRRSKQSASEAARLSYGPDAVHCSPDVSAEELKELTEEFYKSVDVSSEKIKEIEASSKKQSFSAIWRNERAKRLTSSNFGEVITRKTNTAVAPLVKRILYTKFQGNQFTVRGLDQEHYVIEKYQLHQAKLGKYCTIVLCNISNIIMWAFCKQFSCDSYSLL